MGPQLDSCGRQVYQTKTAARAWLQWGRNLTVAEGPPRRPSTLRALQGFNGAAT